MAPHSKPPLSPRSRTRVVALALLGSCAVGGAFAHGLTPTPPTALAQSVPVGRGPVAIAVDSRTARAFVANDDGASLSVLDARTGALLRTVALGQHPTALAVDEADGRVFTLNSAVADPVAPSYAAATTASVSVLDARSGALLHTVTPGAIPNALAVDERSGHLFVTNSGDGTLSLLDARSGGVLRTVALGGLPQALAVDAQAGRVFVAINGPAARLVVLDSRSGRRLRSLVVGQNVGAVVAVPRAGRVVVASDGALRVLDARRGTLVSVVRAQAVPLLADEVSGRVLVGGAAGLRLLDVRHGRLRGPTAVPGTGRGGQPVWREDAAVDAVAGRFAVLTRTLGRRPQERLYLLDGRSGHVLWSTSTPAGAAPVALAVDRRTQHAFVLTQALADAPRAGERGHWLRAWARRWLPWLPFPWPHHDTETGRVGIVDLQPRAGG